MRDANLKLANEPEAGVGYALTYSPKLRSPLLGRNPLRRAPLGEELQRPDLVVRADADIVRGLSLEASNGPACRGVATDGDVLDALVELRIGRKLNLISADRRGPILRDCFLHLAVTALFAPLGVKSGVPLGLILKVTVLLPV